MHRLPPLARRAVQCAMLLVLFAWIAPGSPAAQQAPETRSSDTSSEARTGLALGVAVPLSGEYGAIGRQVVEAARLAASETKTRLVVVDTKGSAEGAAKAIETLAADGDVVAVLGPLGSAETRAAAAVAQREKLPLFTLSSIEAINLASGWIFRLRQSPAEQAEALARFARVDLDLERVAILFPDKAYGRGAALAFARVFTEAGGEVTALASYPEDTTDFRDVLDTLVGKKVAMQPRQKIGKFRANARGFARVKGRATVDFDGLFIPDFHDRIARILPFLPLAGMQNGQGGEGVAVQLLGLAGWQGQTMRFAGTTGAGALYVDPFAGEDAGGRAEEFSRLYEGETGRRPVDLDAEVFDGVWLLGALASSLPAGRKGSKARGALTRMLPRTDWWTGVCGPLKFGPRGEPVRRLGIYRFDTDGTVTPAY